MALSSLASNGRLPLASSKSETPKEKERALHPTGLDAIDRLAGTQTDFADLPPGTRAIALPDNSYNRSSAFLRVFGRPSGESVCECERVQSSSLAQSLHLINSPEMKAKLANPGGRAARLAKDDKPVATMLLNMASIKDSYANYEREHKALYG